MPAVKHKEDTRELLLLGARQCLREKGYARTTARDLAAASGANLASIGYHFGSKEALLNDAILAGFESWTSEIEAAAFSAVDADPLERLEISLAAMVDRFEELRPFLVSYVESFPQAMRSEELSASMAAAYERTRLAGAQMILRALGGPGVIDEAHSRVLSSLLIAVCDGLILQWLVKPSAAPRSAEIVQATVRAATAMLTPEPTR